MSVSDKEISTEVKRAIERIEGLLPGGQLSIGEPMAAHTSFRIGGPAAALADVNNEEELSEVLGIVTEERAAHMMIGNGTNLLVADEGYPGIAIRLSGRFEEIERLGACRVRAGAAVLLSKTSAYLTQQGLSGFEFASGIPGSIGGAVFMNAGAYGGEMKDVVRSVRAMEPDGSAVKSLSGDDMEFGYRHSAAEERGYIILSAELELSEDDPAEIASRVAELQAKRNAKQPVNYPSAGSTFKRPVGGYAAALIEASGLKGFRAGGAEVSEKHSGFVINTGGASSEDVLSVMRHVREKVYEDSGIMLEPEVRLINCSL